MSGEKTVIQEIRRELQKNANEQYRQSILRFFKESEEIKLLGVKSLEPVFEITDILLLDKDDMVQKDYG